MKILIVSSYESQGGAAIAALRLQNSLLKENIDSSLLVQNKRSNRLDVLSDEGLVKKGFNIIRPVLDSIPTRFYKDRELTLFSPSMLPLSGVVDRINQINPDIVHFHWICGGMIKIEDISKITAPIVWTLHDNWAFTGGCHIKATCERHKDSCGACPVLHSSNKNDLSSKVWKRKMKTFSSISSLTIIGLSNWLNNLSKESSLLKDRVHYQLPNPIDCDIYRKIDKNMAKELWGLPQDKKIIVFGAMDIYDTRKGYLQLKEAIGKITTVDVEVVVFGSSRRLDKLDSKVKFHYVGFLYDDISMVTLYNAADVIIVPSLEENLSNVIMEGLACATPVVCFDIGGNSDLIEHKKTGYLAEKLNSDDLARGIDWVLKNDNYNKISTNSRQKVLNEFESSLVAKKYIALYKDLLS